MRFLIPVSIAVFLASALAAQTPATPQRPATPQQPTFKAGVNFVRVDVYPSVNGQIVPDLKRDEFDVFEDGVPQRIETFERVAIRAPGPEAERGDPASIQASNDAAADPRNRVFVVFVDTYHIQALVGKSFRQATGTLSPGLDDAGRAARAVSGFLQRLIGPDDLVALMLPEMPVNAMTFTRRPRSIEEFLQQGLWQRDPKDIRDLDSRDQMYALCYGDPVTSPLTAELVARRHERIVLSTLRGLVVHLQALREERKAILLVSQGWMLFTPRNLAGNSMRRPPAIGVAGGQPTIGDPRNLAASAECERDRQILSDIDDERDFRELLQLANRANATFYPVDPTGLQAPTSAAGWDSINRRQDPLRSLAAETDGIAVVNNNDLNVGLKRILDDVSSYYLLGYYSTNAKADGKFRRITVRVKRPGVAVHARPGYLAPTAAEVTAADEANVLAPNPDDGGLRAALATLEFGRPDRILLLRGAYAWPAHLVGQDSTRAAAPDVRPALASVVVELEAAAARGPGWAEGGQLSATILDPDGRALASSAASISATSRSCLIRFADTPLPPGTYFARVKAQWSVMTTTEQVRIEVPEVSAGGVLGQPIVFRRGPYTGPAFQPTADLRFRKAERIRLDVPVAASIDSIAGRLLDRKGQPLQVPVTPTRRDDGGAAVVTADVTLAPLAPGDYVIAISVRRGEKTDKVLTAIRIVP